MINFRIIDQWIVWTVDVIRWNTFQRLPKLGSGLVAKHIRIGNLANLVANFLFCSHSSYDHFSFFFLFGKTRLRSCYQCCLKTWINKTENKELQILLLICSILSSHVNRLHQICIELIHINVFVSTWNVVYKIQSVFYQW